MLPVVLAKMRPWRGGSERAVECRIGGCAGPARSLKRVNSATGTEKAARGPRGLAPLLVLSSGSMRMDDEGGGFMSCCTTSGDAAAGSEAGYRRSASGRPTGADIDVLAGELAQAILPASGG